MLKLLAQDMKRQHDVSQQVQFRCCLHVAQLLKCCRPNRPRLFGVTLTGGTSQEDDELRQVVGQHHHALQPDELACGVEDGESELGDAVTLCKSLPL